MKFFETHAHYNDDVFKDCFDNVIKECRDIGVEYIVNVGYNKESSVKAIELSNRFEFMYNTIGIHPHDVKINSAYDIEEIYRKYDTRKTVAIGEIGLDYAFVNDNKKEQIELFISQIELANTLKLPIVVHTREAAKDTYEVLKAHKPQFGALLHCFHPTDELVKLVLNEGYYVAFGGNITYKRSKSFASYVKMIPIERIVIETDSPYLPPEPYRGKINTSKNLPIICNKLAEYKEMDNDVVSKFVFNNACKFFNIKDEYK